MADDVIKQIRGDIWRLQNNTLTADGDLDFKRIRADIWQATGFNYQIKFVRPGVHSLLNFPFGTKTIKRKQNGTWATDDGTIIFRPISGNRLQGEHTISLFSNSFSVDFDGSTMFGNAGNVIGIEGLGSFAVQYWAKPDSNVSNQWVYRQDGNFWCTYRPSTLDYVGHIGGSTITVSVSKPSNGIYFNDIYNYDGADIDILRDGNTTPIGTTARTGSLNTSGNNLLFAAASVTPTALFNGRMDEITFFDRALTDAEITRIGAGSPIDMANDDLWTNVLHHWRNGDGIGDVVTSVKDQKGSADMALTGVSAFSTDVPP